MKQLGLLIRLIIGIIAGILIGMCGQWFGIADTAFFVTIIRLLATFTSLFSTFLSFMIPLIILSFITVGMAEAWQEGQPSVRSDPAAGLRYNRYLRSADLLHRQGRSAGTYSAHHRRCAREQCL